MKILVIFIFIFLIAIISVLTFIILKLKKSIKRSETQILKMLRQMRYGQFHVNISTFKNENIKLASAKLLESLNDREMMIAEYKQLLIAKNKSLEKMIEYEKETQKFKDDFIAALTHDLKTPVIAEVNAIKMLLAGTFGEIADSQKEVLNMMLKSDEDLIELSEMLLQSYKYQQCEIIFNKEEVCLNNFITDITNEMTPILVSKNQKFIINKLDDNIIVNVDKMHFKRVLHNLFINASKYGFQDTEIVININQDDKNVFIGVTNSGEAIKAEDIELIFQKYYSGLNKFSNLGTGLGLYCANKIVNGHSGKIEVSTENNKTEFRVILPK